MSVRSSKPFKLVLLLLTLFAGVQLLAAQGPAPPDWALANPATPGPLPGRGLAQHPFVYCGEFDHIHPQQTMWLVRDGKVAWTYSIPTRMMVHGKDQMAELGDCTRFSNGNILFSYRWGASIVTPGKKIVWNYDAPPNTELHSAQPAGNHRVLLALNGAPTKLLLIDTVSGKIEKELELPTLHPDKIHGQVRRAHLTKAGTFLVGHIDQNKVVEYDSNGKEIWSADVPGAWDAVRLKDGNTLVSGNQYGFVREINPKGETVWEINKDELSGYPLDVVQEVDRLANGNTVFANWVAGNTKPENWPSTIQIIEVTPAKKVVWALRQWSDPDLGPASSIQLLDQPGKPENGDLER
jgi:Mal s 1 allergenic protein-like